MTRVHIWLPHEPSEQRLATCAERVLPDFIVIGAQRCGTTTLYDHLVTHPSVLPAVMKEIHYFDAWFHKGPCWYRAHFPLRTELDSVPGCGMTGEATPFLLFDPAAPACVAATIPSVRLIAILRDPIERAHSHYHHQRLRGNEDLPTFQAALEHEIRGQNQAQEGPPDPYRSDRDRSYLARGHYAEQLRRWIQVFGRDALLVLYTDDLRNDPAGTLLSTWRWLGLPDGPRVEPKTWNTTRRTAMSERTRQMLDEYFAPHDQALHTLLGSPPPWRESTPDTDNSREAASGRRTTRNVETGHEPSP